MKLYRRSIDWYVKRLAWGEHFSLAGYSDAEWLSILGLRAGERTALGQVIDPEHGKLLADVLRRRQDDPRFLVAVPECLVDGSRDVFGTDLIDSWLTGQGIRLEAVERDRVTDDLAREAGLYPLIRQLRAMRTVLIGNHALEPVAGLLGCDHFVGVSAPNLHREPSVFFECLGPGGAVQDAWRRAEMYGKPGVYLVSAGVSAAVIIDALHDRIPGSWLIDCGSIWDAFAGIGGQREWRTRLYADPQAWEAWKRRNLHGD